MPSTILTGYPPIVRMPMGFPSKIKFTSGHYPFQLSPYTPESPEIVLGHQQTIFSENQT